MPSVGMLDLLQFPAGVGGDDLVDDLARTVAARVVHEDDLARGAHGVEDAKRLGEAPLEQRLFVVTRDDEGQVGARAHDDDCGTGVSCTGSSGPKHKVERPAAL
jgi:hypothetical protein